MKQISEYEVFGTFLTNPIKFDTQMVRFNACEENRIINILDEITPDIVIWSIKSGKTEVETMKMSFRRIVDYTVKNNKKLVYISTDLFKGNSSYYTEEYEADYFDEQNPYAPYINGKVLGEKLALEDPNSIIIRTGMIYGLDYYGDYDRRMTSYINSIKLKEEVELYDNMYKTFTNIKMLVEVIIELIRIDYRGILHVANTKRMSIHNFYKEQLESLGMNVETIKKVRLCEKEVKEKKYCLDTSMDTSVLLKLVEGGQIYTSLNTALPFATHISSSGASTAKE